MRSELTSMRGGVLSILDRNSEVFLVFSEVIRVFWGVFRCSWRYYMPRETASDVSV